MTKGWKASRVVLLRTAAIMSLGAAMLPPDSWARPGWDYNFPLMSPAAPAGDLILVQENGTGNDVDGGDTDGGDADGGDADGGDADSGDTDGGSDSDAGGDGNGGNEGQGPSGFGERGDGGFPSTSQNEATTGIVMSLQAAERHCSPVPLEYRMDCLAQAFRLTANLTRERPEYAAVSMTLHSASLDLSRLVSQNSDQTAPRVRSAGRIYRAVRPEAVASVIAQAEEIITQTQTRLLRSTGSVGQAHYQRIAQAVGSTKRILRS